MNQRVGMTHISSMCAVCTPKGRNAPDHTSAPWESHWSRTCQHETRPRIITYESSGVTRAKLQCTK